MTYLLDTCIISRLRKLKKTPDTDLSNWITKHSENQFYLSSLTLGEIQAGIAKLKSDNLEESKQKMILEEWLFGDLIPRFQNRILEITLPIALKWGDLAGKARQKGEILPAIDGLIAATAIHHNFIVVTDNTKHFAPHGVITFNPWLTKTS